MVTPLQIRTFGRLSLILGQINLTFDAHSAEALLVYLACQRRPVSREALAELFWPERSQQQARTNLRGALHRLRQPLEPYLLVTRQSVALQPAAALDLDCAHFESHLAAGQLAAAMTLYQGDFLVNFYLDGSPAFEQWALLERERLRTLAISAAQQLIRQLMATGQVDLAIAGAQRLLQLDPLHEPTHRQLMRLLAQVGQRSAALAQFEACRHLFHQELDVPPDAATTALYEQIRTNDIRFAILDFGLSAPPDGDDNPKSKIQNPKLNNLPPQPTPFIGREPELVQIAALLANPDCRLLSLLGSGGMGKTRLAVEAAARQVDRFADGICFVPLAAVSAPEFLVGAIAQSLNITLRDDNLVTQVVNHLRGRQLLLVLDNFEHLLETADVVATLVRSAPRVKVLVTTRSRLQLIEEWLLPVDGLPSDNDPRGAASQLFLRSAQRVQPTFSANGQSEMINAICRQVGGMPLAIELAASWVRLMSCAAIARQLGHNFDLLSTPLRNLPERHRSLRVLFDQSWRLLTKPEQEMLMGLSVFQGGWTIDEAVSILDGTPLIVLEGSRREPSEIQNQQSKMVNLLLALVDKSFVRSNGENRYDLHELVHQYAAEQLACSGAEETIRQRHFATYLALARTADSHLRGPEGREWFQRLEREQGNIRAALRWATDHGHAIDVAWMGFALSCFWTQRVRFGEAVAWLEPLLDQAKAWSVELRLTHLLNLYNAWTGVLNYQAIDHHASELMALAEACNNPILYAGALLMLAMSESAISQIANLYAQAIALVRPSVGSFVGDCANHRADNLQGSVGLSAEFGQFGDTIYLLANLLLGYGDELGRQGEYTQANAYYQESLALFRAQGECDMIASPLGALGCMALTHGDLAAAQRYIGEAVTIVQAVGNALDFAHWHACLALVKLYAGNVEEAWQLLQVCLLHDELRQTFYVRKAYLVAGMIALTRKEFTSAEVFLRDSLATYRLDRVIYPDLADCLFTAARLAAAQQHYKRAATLFGLAERLRVELCHTLDAPVRPLIDAALTTVQAALEPAAFAEAFAAGQQLSIEEALATVLAVAQAPVAVER